ncbi:coupling factor for flagellin transcription and translation [Halobacillus litoralis]|uniref:coupling factor for flagellin transcription and translation n=1 Tax=Halobacillus litoralis TaxID=45668 RepID=UPI001CD3D76B|nr:coupling factor for flagellin transcription and translation [Halobacillus litoralis]MCA0969112.1 coupling factor for flagellin transcription and translation [Halobacillus litoralis]
MTIYLLVISFIIDGVLLFGLFTLRTQIKKTEELELRQQEIASDIEGMFSSYLMEIKEENQRMSELIDRQPSYGEKVERMEEVQKKEPSKRFPAPEYSPLETDYQPPEPVTDPPEESFQPSVPSQIMDLKERGYTIDEIAKKLDRGKTEIELLLKFNQKK